MKFKIIIIFTLTILSIGYTQPAFSANSNVYTITVDDSYKNMGIVDFGKSILKKFYEKYPDKYDFITIYTDFNSIGSLQSQTIKSDIVGIGKIIADDYQYFNSLGRLKSISLMYNIDDSTMPFTFDIEKDYQFFEQIAHETSHYWLVYDISDGQNCTQLNNCKGGQRLTTGYNHWSILLNTCTETNGQFFRDPNGGGCWQDNQNGTFTQIDTHDKKVKFSSLSFFLAGLTAKDTNGNTFIIETNDPISNTIQGVKKQVFISDIIKYTNSERVPDYNNSQKHFNMAFILALNNKSEMTLEQSKKMNYLADNFSAIWSEATNNISTINSGQADIIDDLSSDVNNPDTPASTPTPNPVQIDMNLAKRLKGRLLLQVEGGGNIWYVDTNKYQRYSVTWTNALPLFKKLSLGITDENLLKIKSDISNLNPNLDTDNDGYKDILELQNNYNPYLSGNYKFKLDVNLSDRLKGKLLLQVNQGGAIWYVDVNNIRHNVRWNNLMYLFESLALGITDNDLYKIPIGNLN